MSALLAVPEIDGIWVSALRDWRLIAHGKLKEGHFSDNGLHECNGWLYDALVCAVLSTYYRDQPADEPEQRFKEVSGLVRQHISMGNSTYRNRIDNWISQLTFTHLGSVAQTIYDGRHEDRMGLIQAFADYIVGHALLHADVEPCHQDDKRGTASRTVIDQARDRGSATLINGRQWEERYLRLIDDRKITAG